MVGENKKGGDMVLESRHLVGLFFLWIVVSGVVFTLGYLLGRNQTGRDTAAVQASNTQPAARPDASAPGDVRPDAGVAPAKSPSSSTSEWESYRATSAAKTPAAPKSATKSVAPVPAEKKTPSGAPSPQPVAAKQSLLNAPAMPKNAIRLQVAAVVNEKDALALAEALQKKKFPAFVLTPQTDQYYRVQVGPYADLPAAKAAQKGLEREGFKAIVKR